MELAELAKSLGRDLSEPELDSAMAVMDADGSGEVDLQEFTEWFKKNKEEKGGLFGGLFSDPLSLSDSYVQLTINLRKKEKELRLVWSRHALPPASS